MIRTLSLVSDPKCFRIWFTDGDTVLVPKDISKLMKRLLQFKKDKKIIENVQ